MIGAQTIDPAENDRRQKAIQQALAARMRAAVGAASRTGVGRGARTGPGIRYMTRGAHPTAPTSFLSSQTPAGYNPAGEASYYGQGGGLGALVSATQLPSQALPGGAPPSAPPAAPPAPAPEPPAGPSAPNPGDPLPPGYSGYIPLGGGVFYDPETGQLHGGGLV